MEFKSIDVPTKAYDDQKPGTSGLRKKTSVFESKPNYLENFIQATLTACESLKVTVKEPLRIQPGLNDSASASLSKTIESLVIGGDGRYPNAEFIGQIVNICAANKVKRIYVAHKGVMSTPAGSVIIRKLKASGGFILSASHNPGGPSGDFGIKFNNELGAPANEDLTSKIFEISKSISSIRMLDKKLDFNLKPSNMQEKIELKVDGERITIEYIDAIEEYCLLAKALFDFDKIKTLFDDVKFLMVADSMHAVMAYYVDKILINELGMSPTSHLHSDAREDFGGLHPDPNLVYASSLVDKLKSDLELQFGVAFDGDGDRNMVLGQGGFFVAPSDSLAVIAANYKCLSRAFPGGCLKGVARSMPTAPAIDRFARENNLNVYETPTGWKYFCNLFEANLMSICGEESFGLGANHIREKDGLWACLAWLTIIAERKMSVKELVHEYWQKYGRDYFSRYDYESVDSCEAKAVVDNLNNCIKSRQLIGKRCSERLVVENIDNFEYTDPVTKCVVSNQGYRIVMTNGARIIIRLSGTGSSGETIRIYFNDYSTNDLYKEPAEFLAELIEIGLNLTKIHTLTSRTKPTVIT